MPNASGDDRSRQLFGLLMGKEVTHLRVGQGKVDGTEVRVLGTVAEMHGPEGVCRCCHGRGKKKK